MHTLNYLLGKDDINSAVRRLWSKNSDCFSVLDILLGVRARDNKKAINRNNEIQPIELFFKTPEGVLEFLEDTGLENVFQNRQIVNLVDYVFGVEVGLDTNARKNRSGHIMENKIVDLLSKAGVEYEQEVYSKEFPVIHQALGVDEKRFDFVIKSAGTTFLMEVNFYNGGGSKLNEVARAYTDLAPKINACKGYEFVWVTDGVGWKCARGKLEEAFHKIPRIYNLTTFPGFLKSLNL